LRASGDLDYPNLARSPLDLPALETKDPASKCVEAWGLGAQARERSRVCRNAAAIVVKSRGLAGWFGKPLRGIASHQRGMLHTARGILQPYFNFHLWCPMNRLVLLSCALAPLVACDVGDVPAGLKPDAGSNVICEQSVDETGGHHREGEVCITCHKTGLAPPLPNGIEDGPDFLAGGTLYETATGAPKGNATIVISWTGGSAKLYSSTGAAGPGNFHGVAGDFTGITYPATVKVSLCPENERKMATPLANEGDLDCSRSGCHGSGTAKVYWKQ
jgi:hypothetical protein